MYHKIQWLYLNNQAPYEINDTLNGVKFYYTDFLSIQQTITSKLIFKIYFPWKSINYKFWNICPEIPNFPLNSLKAEQFVKVPDLKWHPENYSQLLGTIVITWFFIFFIFLWGWPRFPYFLSSLLWKTHPWITEKN